MSWLVVVMLAGGVEAAPLATPPPSASPPSQPEDGLKARFEALPEPERRAIQDALLWTGDFAGVVNGAFGSRTRDGLTAFARRNGLSPDAALDAKSRAHLLSSAAAARAEVGFAPVKDKQAGVTVALPVKLLTRRVSTDGGTHYASADDAIVVDTLSRPAGPGGLGDLFARMSAASGPRRVTYKLLKPDFFVVSGDIADRKFYSRFVIGASDGQMLIRGLTLSYGKAAAARFDPVALAAAASFEAFPAVDGSTPPLVAAPKVPPPAATVAVSAIRIDHAVALAHLGGQSCLQPSLDGAPVVLRKSDGATGLALFDVPAAAQGMATLTQESAAPTTPLLALFRRDAGGLDVAPAELQPSMQPSPAAFVVSTGLQGRAEGSPIVDHQGVLVGVVAVPRHAAPSLAGTQLQGDYPVVSAAGLRSFLDAAGVALAPPAATPATTLAAVVAAWRPLLLTIICRTADAAP